MNRTAHLIESTRRASQLSFHREHVVLDYGSTTPVSRGELPSDGRIRLMRVENPERKWWLTHSYNLAFALSSGDHILKLDADVLLEPEFEATIARCLSSPETDLFCNRMTLQDWSLPDGMFTTNGLFFCRRSSLETLGGFNPYLRNWGWDDIDLYSRFFLGGFAVARLASQGVAFIDHEDGLREPAPEKADWGRRLGWRSQPTPRRRMWANNEKNRRVAVAAVAHQLAWPRAEDYRQALIQRGRLPDLPRVRLFNPAEAWQLKLAVAHELMKPSPWLEPALRTLGTQGLGPYGKKAVEDLLKSSGIDLEIFT